MIYKLDNKPLSSFSAHPERTTQFYALHGIFDLPKRIGKTEHDWGTSIEPFVQAEDITFDGRLLVLNVVVRTDLFENLKNACVTCKKLTVEAEEFEVVCRDEIKVTEIGIYSCVKIPFWQYNFKLKKVVFIPSASGVFRLDDFDLIKDFGIYVSKSNNRSNAAKRIDVKTTEFYKKTQYRASREIIFVCSMRGDSFADLYSKMNQFHAVVMAPGMRTLLFSNKAYSVYFKDGIRAEIIDEKICKFRLKATII